MKESNPNFCTGVQILLSRMESNPEEFISGDKWYWIMSKVVDTKRNPTHHSNTLAELTPEEINALFDAYTPFLRKRFDDSVLREVLSSEEKELSYSVTSAPPAVLGNSPYAFGYANHTQHIALHQQAIKAVTLNIGNASLSEEEIKTIKRRVL